MIVVRSDSGSYGRLTEIPETDGLYLQQAMLHEVITKQLTHDPSAEQTLRYSSPIYALQVFYSQRLTAITSLVRETLQQLERSCSESRSTPRSSEELLQFRGSLKLLKKLYSIAQEIPTTITIELHSDEKTEMLGRAHGEDLGFLITACQVKYDEFRDLYKNEYTATKLRELGWDLTHHKKHLEQFKMTFKKVYYNMIVPDVRISAERTISMRYSWINYLIENQFTPEKLRIFELISKLPKEIEVPEKYICPLTFQIMLFPMRSQYDHIYERSAIIAHLRTKEQCPLTRTALKQADLVPCETLQREICAWVEQQFVKVTAICDVGKGNHITIRGEKGILHWSKGIPLTYVGGNRWEIELPYIPGCRFKFLVNDMTKRWEEGHNHSLSKSPATFHPIFQS